MMYGPEAVGVKDQVDGDAGAWKPIEEEGSEQESRRGEGWWSLVECIAGVIR
jgi:hypothetical protein